MIAARRLSAKGFRCNSCSVSLFNSLFSACGTNARLPVATPRAITSTGHFRVPQRAFHSSATRFNPTKISNELVERIVEPVNLDLEPELQLELGVGSRAGTRTEITGKEFVIEGTKEVDAETLVPGATLLHIAATNGGHGRNEHATAKAHESPAAELEEDLAKETGLVTGNAKEEDQEQVPWFLRVETPRPALHPLAQRQALPELPDDPPPALEPLLKHLSEELGINDMALIDLRSMDPPPAIGAGTIMVLGNARSERHLHTSADKTCRWLRSEWKMAPYADGLLGRNELKIKNRRLRKKGKLVGTEMGVEEGVGWICVDVGSQGLVVQLFTPHRREEIDLEELWGNFLKKSGITRSPRSEPVPLKEISAEKSVGEAGDGIVRYTPVRLGVGLSTGSSYFNTKKRSFHTAIPRRILESIGNPLKPKSHYVIDGILFTGVEVPKVIRDGRPWPLIIRLPPTYSPDSHNLVSELILLGHVNHLKIQFPGLKATGSRSGPCTLLGSGPEDKTSTDFLKTFHDNLPKTPTIKQFQLHLEFLIEAHRVTPAKYPASCFLHFLDSMLASSIRPPPEFYYLVLRAFSESPSYRNNPLPRKEATAAHLAAMNEVVSHMKLHCLKPNAHGPEFQFCFLRALTNFKLPIIQHLATTICDQTQRNAPDHVVKKYSQKLHMGSYNLDPRVHVLDRELREADHTYTLREYQETLLVAYAMSGAWTAFWNVWKRLRYNGVYRDERFYALVVGLLVMAWNQRECVYALRTLVNGMERELPSVRVTEGLANGMLKLLECAEGMKESVATEEKSEEEVKGEWKVLRGKCEAVIRRERLKRGEVV